MKKLLFNGKHGDVTTIFAAFVELDNTINKSEEGVILAHTDILARVVDRTALTDDNVAGDALLTAKNLNA